MSKEPATMIYTLNLGPYDTGIDIRQVTIEVDGVVGTKVVNVSTNDNTVDISGFENAKANLKIVDIDTKGNKTPIIVLDMVLEDSVNQPTGSVVTVVAVREIPGKKMTENLVPVKGPTLEVKEPTLEVKEPTLEVKEPTITEEPTIIKEPTTEVEEQNVSEEQATSETKSKKVKKAKEPKE